MGFIEKASDYMSRWFNKDNVMYLSQCYDLIADTVYKEIGISKVINMIASSFVSTNIRTFEKHEEVKKAIYYKLNISPNLNSNKYDFYCKLINNLIRNQEALIIENNKDLFVADSFTKKEFAFKNYKFTDIVIDDYQLKDTFYMNEVFYFKINDEKIKSLVQSINDNYASIATLMKNTYVKDRMTKIILKADTSGSLKNKEGENTLQDTIENLIKPFIEGQRNVLAIPKGFDFEKFENGTNTKENITELVTLGEQIINEIATIFNIPIDLIYGNKNELEQQEQYYMTHCFKKYAEMFSSEITRKLYSFRQWQEGTYIKMDLVTTEYINWLYKSDKLDKAFSIGFSHNTILDKLGEEKVNEEWADKSYVTKNYMNAEGGENEYEQDNATE